GVSSGAPDPTAGSARPAATEGEPMPSGTLRAVVPPRDIGPVDHVPPGRDVVRPAVLVFEVVGVLPHVAAEDGLLARHERRVLVGGALDGEPAALFRPPPTPRAGETAPPRLPVPAL